MKYRYIILNYWLYKEVINIYLIFEVIQTYKSGSGKCN